MLNALKMNRKAFTRKENPIPADKNQTLTQIEPSMPKQGGGGALQGIRSDVGGLAMYDIGSHIGPMLGPMFGPFQSHPNTLAPT